MSYDRSRFWGMDPEQAHTGSRQMHESAGAVQGMMDQLSALLDSVTWEGEGAKAAVGDWNGSVRPELRKATEALAENATELGRRARMQEEASS